MDTSDLLPVSVTDLSSLARPFDLSLASNRHALEIAAASAAAGLLAGLGRSGALRRTLAAGGWALSTWSLGREYDPDHPVTASLAAAAAGAAAAGLAGGPGHLALDGARATSAAMLATRVVARSSGRSTRPLDLVIVAGAALAAGLVDRSAAGLAVAAGAALVADALEDGDAGRAIAAAALATGAGVAGAGLGRPAPEATPISAATVLAVCGIAAAALAPSRPPATRADDGGPLEPGRLALARAVVGLAAGVLLGARQPHAALGIAAVTLAAGLRGALEPAVRRAAPRLTSMAPIAA